MRLDFIPEGIEISACSSVVSDVVEGVGDPEGGDRNISLHHLECFQGADGQVVLDHVVGFNTVLNEEVVALDSVPNIVGDVQVMDSVYGEDSGE